MSDDHEDTTKAKYHAQSAGLLSDMLSSTRLEFNLLGLSPKKLSELPEGLWRRLVLYFEQPPKKRGRPREITKRQMWAIGAKLRTEDKARWSWAKLACKLDPAGYKKNSRQATDRIRKGIESILAEAKKDH